MIKAVLFDLDNTMYNYDTGHVKAMEAVKKYCQEELAVEEEQLNCEFEKARRIQKARLRTKDSAAVHNRLIRFQCMLELLGLPVVPHARKLDDIYWGTILANAEPEPGLLELLRMLKQKGVHVGIASNMTAYRQYQKLEKIGVVPYLDEITTSEETGVEKPDPHFFKICMEKTGCSPEECLFVGDSFINDVEGASQAGMQAVWYHPQENREAAGGYVRSFRDCIEGTQIKIGDIRI